MPIVAPDQNWNHRGVCRVLDKLVPVIIRSIPSRLSKQWLSLPELPDARAWEDGSMLGLCRCPAIIVHSRA